jgi:Ca2+-binding RTX toxin-like protein
VTADDVPEGSAYIGLRSKDGDASIRFEFHTTAYQVSADVNAANDIGMIAYNAKGEEIAAASVTGVQAAAWRTNFISLSSKEPIQSVVFTGTNLVIDQLFFSNSRPRTVEVGDGFQGPPTHLSKEPLILRGNERPNELFGGKAADTIFGGKGRDKVFAGNGNDLIIGGHGRDKLWGEEGQDSFMFRRLHKVADRLKDFDPAEDTIFLAGKDFKGLAPGRLDEDQFSDGAVTKATRVHYDAETGDLAFITSGSWPRWVLLAKLDADLDMTARDILVG